MSKAKKPSESVSVMTEIVMPNDANALNNLMGGNLLKWLDVAAAICARRHAECTCVTAAVDNVSFKSPIKIGEIVTITAKATRVFNTSMEVELVVHAEGMGIHRRRKCNEAFMTFVGIDEWGNKIHLPPLLPETETEKQEFDAALRRREMRLILAGRMQPNQSEQLMDLFLKAKKTL